MEPAYLDAAFRIGGRLVRDALWHDGRCNWFSPVYEELGGMQRLGAGTLGPGLYEGTAGIALFLGLLHRATGDRAFAATAEGAIAHALSRLDDVPASVRSGFYTGFVGLGFAATEVGRCLDRSDLIRRGLDVAAAIAAVDRPSEAVLDVMSGYAGAIPAWLRMSRAYGDERLFDLACAGAAVLLDRSTRGERGLSWDTLADMRRTVDPTMIPERIAAALADSGGPHLLGLSHGAGGIAWALLELGVATGEKDYLDGARAGFAYEDSWFDDAGFWPDLRGHDRARQPDAPSAWCHGAVGIGLVRARAFQLTGETAHRDKALAALAIAERALRAGLDDPAANFSLCHGLAGDAELFLLWMQVCGDVSMRQPADEVARRGLASHHQRGQPPWPSGIEGRPEAPGLMLGLAGTGHFYLRMADPAATPSILLVVPPAAEDDRVNAKSRASGS